MLVLSKFNTITICVLAALSTYLVGCDSQQFEEAHQLQQPLTYAGPPLSIPLPAGMLWKVNTNPGFSSPAVTYHSGVYYHAIDFGDNFYVGDTFYDEGDGVIDVLASADGKVSEVVEKPNCSNGPSGRACKVFVNHSEAKRGVGYETEYTHLSPGTIVVSVGQNIKRGQKIGKLGWTGTGKPHLHFSLRHNNDGSKNNPALAGVKLENVPFINYALDQRYPSTNGFTFNSASNPTLCQNAPTGSAATNWVYTCNRPTSTFSSAFNPTVYGLLYVENIFKNFKFVTKVFNNGQHLFTHDPTTFTIVEPWIWRYAYTFPEIQRPLPGTWRMEVYLVYDDGKPGVHLKDLSFTVTL